ncbi:MAG: hypothetical protein HFE63_01495 [Clostridiales bacterium]|nr:hypothetical protein [Clostridiales bacterium]
MNSKEKEELFRLAFDACEKMTMLMWKYQPDTEGSNWVRIENKRFCAYHELLVENGLEDEYVDWATSDAKK